APPADKPSGTAPIAGPGAMAAAGRLAEPVRPSQAPSRPSPPPPEGALPSSGDLARTSPLHLYYLAAAGNLNGLLSLQLSDRTVEIHFRKGNPEYVGSSHVEDDAARFLLAQGAVSTDAVAKAEAEKGRFGGELLGALFGLGLLNPTTAFAALAQRASTLLLRGLSTEYGPFTFEEKELAAHRAMPLGNRWAVLLEAARRLALPELHRRLQSASDLPVMKSGGRVALSDLRLTPQETRALGYIDGVRSLNWLAHDLPQDAEHFFRLAFVLRELEIVSFAAAPMKPPPSAASTVPDTVNKITAAPIPAAPRAAAPKAPPPAKPASTAPAVAAPKAPSPQDFEAQIADLRKRVAGLKEQNHFQVLGLDVKADAPAVKNAYFKLARVFHPDTVPADAPAALGPLKASLFGAISEAYRTLSDDAARAEYAEELKSGTQGQKVDVSQIFQAEDSFQKGCILVKLRKFPEALALLDEAIRLNPDEGEFYAWRGFARFFTSPDKKQALGPAQQDIQISLKRNERCAPAHYFLGQLAKLTGDNAGALKHFKRTVEIQPEHTDAQRELRLLNSRK
ncbi:MAG TPA: DnaJ domain-containing protein, partial [Myxococcaceae bacterium]|nr:DnaJ domain-containing protein [Myxococcaceae bacterium]